MSHLGRDDNLEVHLRKASATNLLPDSTDMLQRLPDAEEPGETRQQAEEGVNNQSEIG
jgi:hypothetical protein